MRKIIKQFASYFLIPLAKWYLRKERKYRYQEIEITVLPGVFHPGMFSSTLFILEYLEKQILSQKKLLEIGCGTGLISICAAKANAQVTASDLSLMAIKNTAINSKLNNVKIHIVHSDLFTQLAKCPFDWIIVNPPYYARDPKNANDLAWYCGQNHEYFEKFFSQLCGFMASTSQVIMVLTKGCNLEKIIFLGTQAGLTFELIEEKSVFFDEKDFLYRISIKAFDQPVA